MLNTKKEITITGNSTINGEIAEGYQAVINSENPQDMRITSWQQNAALCKAGRTECRKDRADFEDAAYKVQDDMLAEMEG